LTLIANSHFDVVLESVGGAIVDPLLQAMSFGGRIVVYDQASGASNFVSLDTLMDRSIGVLGFWLTPFQKNKPATRKIIEELLALIAQGNLHIVEGPVFPISRACDAHASIEAARDNPPT
jgi:NADPH:quinone reductase-like Zn-dependent oxidoreductase